MGNKADKSREHWASKLSKHSTGETSKGNSEEMNTNFTKVTEKSIPKDGEYGELVVLDGDIYPPQVRVDMHRNAEEFEVRDDDIFVVTYSKAGTHWMTEIVKSILTDGDYEKAEKIFGIHPKPLEYFDTFEKVVNAPRDQQRLLITHLHEEILPKAALNGKAKVIFVVRNPKDSAVSYFKFVHPFRYCEEFETWESFLQCFMTEKMPGRSWFDYNLRYWKHRNEKNFYVTTYEDMKMDIRSVIDDIASFLGHPQSSEKLDKLVNLASFSRMNKKYDGRLPKDSVPDKVREAIPFHILRKGQVGDWKNHFTVAQNEAFDKLYEEKMKGSSLKHHIKFEI